jgi:hypothetical protein
MAITTFTALKDAPVSQKTVIARMFPTENISAGTWSVVGGHANTYSMTLDTPNFTNLDSVTEDGTSLTERATIALVNANAGSWYYDVNAETLYVHTTGTDDPTDHLMVATHTLAFSDQDSTLDSIYHEPRIIEAPDLDLEGGRLFWGVSFPSEGTLTLNNEDGFFDSIFRDFIWYNAKCTVYLGGEDLPLSEYRVIFDGFVVDNIPFTRTRISFKLKDKRWILDSKYPSGTKYDTSTFPNVEKKWRDNPIPRAYGVIRNAPAPNITRYVEISRDAGSSDTTIYVAGIDSTYFPATGTLKFGTEEMTYTGTAASPPRFTGVTRGANGTTPATHDRGTIGILLTNNYFKIANSQIDSIDRVYKDDIDVTDDVDNITLADATFRYNATIDGSEKFTVDFGGVETGGGALMSNYADVLSDLLQQIGIASGDLNAASFTAAATAAEGTVGFWIGKPEKGTKLIDILLRSTLGRLYINLSGEIALQIWEPTVSTAPATFDETDILDYKHEQLADNVFEKIIVEFDQNWSDTDDFQTAEKFYADASSLYGGGRVATVKTVETSRADAETLADRLRFVSQIPAERVSVKAKMVVGDLVVSDQRKLTLTRPTTSEKLYEVTGVRISTGNATDVDLEFEDLHGMGEETGVWTSDVAPAWAAATDDEKLVQGFWSDDDGLVDPADPTTKNKSRWW